MPERAKTILLYGLAYPAFFLLFFVIGAYLTFPYDHVKEYISQEAGRGGTTSLQIGTLEPSWLTGVYAEDVRLTMLSEDGSFPPATTHLRQARARVSLLSLLAGGTDVTYSLAIEGGGEVEGRFAQNDERMIIQSEITNVDLRRVGALRPIVRLPMTGMLRGEIDLTIASEAADTEGSVDLTLANLSIADGETQLVLEALGPLGRLTPSQMNVGNLRLRLETERGVAQIRQFEADGEHVELRGTGNLRLTQPLAASTIDMLLRVNFKEAYRTSHPRMEGLFAGLEMSPDVRPARTPDGAFQWRVRGTFGSRILVPPAGREPMPGVD